VSNDSGINQFESIDRLPHLFIHSNTTLTDVRCQLLNKLIELEQLPVGATADHIRLRDKTGTNPGRILGGSKSFADNNIFLCDNKTILFQILDEAEDLPSYESGDTVVFVQRWIRSTWSLGDKLEVLLRGSMSVSDIAQGLSILMDVSIDSMRTMVVPRDAELPLYELNQKSPPTNFGRSWFDPTQEKRLLRVVSHDLRVRDGDLLLIQDENEPLMELSKADLKSIDIVKSVAQYSDFWGGESGTDYSNIANLYHSMDDTSKETTSTHVPSFTSSTSSSSSSLSKPIRPYAAIRSTGIHIKTQRERQEEEDARLKGSNNNNNNHHTSSCIITSNNDDDGVGYNDMMPEEYSRDDTGFNLFGDIY